MQPIDIPRAHRVFAAELNDLAWTLVEAGARSPADAERMIHAAHAACFHWLEAGTALNHLRAQCLLATAHAKAGYAESAVRHAERCLALFNEADGATPFDRALAHGCASAAYALAGRFDDARSQYQEAGKLVSRFDDPSETALFDKLYPEP
jgi:tetratricopeptide (TPR) repeat protein